MTGNVTMTGVEERIVQRTRRVLKKPAHFKDINTGEFEIKRVRGEDGSITEHTVPILNRVRIDAVFEDVADQVTEYVVTVTSYGVTEEHSFQDKASAAAFMRGE